MELSEENLEYITFVAKEYCHLPEFNDEYSRLNALIHAKSIFKARYETLNDTFQKAYQDFIKKITDLNKQLFQNTKNENPYELTLKEIEKEQSALDSEVKSYSDSKKRRLEIDKWLIGLKKVFVFLHGVHGGAIFDSNLRQQGMSQFNKYPTFAK